MSGRTALDHPSLGSVAHPLTSHSLTPTPPPSSHPIPRTPYRQHQTGRPILIMKGRAIVPPVYEGHKDAGTTIAVNPMMRLGRAPDHYSVARTRSVCCTRTLAGGSFSAQEVGKWRLAGFDRQDPLLPCRSRVVTGPLRCPVQP